ncbi:N-6 DNA methylase [Brachyspira intermedia]|uniref:N-6 DNA methylase n=1 Tax=Brachyspira intermedia TaxID=84377 RepID=UPI0030066B88
MAKKTVYRFKNIYDHIKAAAYSFTTAQVFYDFAEMFAMEIAIGVGIEAEKRIETFKRTASKYKEEELKHYQGFKTEIMNEFIKNDKIVFQDVLGVLFHELELQNHYKGQFFTPYDVSLAMSKLSLGINGYLNNLENEDFIELGEPAAGAGGMVIASCQIASELNINYAAKMIWTLQDLDLMCVYMSYIQLNLIGAAAVVHHMDTLAMERFDTFYTLAYIANNCYARLKAKKQIEKFKKAFDLVKSLDEAKSEEIKIAESKKEEQKQEQYVFDF